MNTWSKHLCVGAALLWSASAMAAPLPYPEMARKIVAALHLQKGERVLLRSDTGDFAQLLPPLQEALLQAGAIQAGSLKYGSGSPTPEALRQFKQLLTASDVYLWLPAHKPERQLGPEEEQALTDWLAKGGRRREIHFHWAEGSVKLDGLPGNHTPALDQIYTEALKADGPAVGRQQDSLIKSLRAGDVHVTTPAGTDLTFVVGARPFNKQDGDASPARMLTAKVKVDREIELPLGALRVAPIETSVNGLIVLPKARFGSVEAEGIKLRIESGHVTEITTTTERQAVIDAFMKAGSVAFRFREFGIGCNPLLPRTAEGVVPYFGYGAGVVRLALGGNFELSGDVPGEYRRWFFFTDASVTVNGNFLVKDGELQQPGVAAAPLL